MQDIISTYLMPILATIITAVASFVGMTIKMAYTKYVNTQTKKEIVKCTVAYVEQVYKNVVTTNEEKLNKAKDKAIEWLNSKGIKVSDTELEILIESAVNGLKKSNELK